MSPPSTIHCQSASVVARILRSHARCRLVVARSRAREEVHPVTGMRAAERARGRLLRVCVSCTALAVAPCIDSIRWRVAAWRDTVRSACRRNRAVADLHTSAPGAVLEPDRLC